MLKKRHHKIPQANHIGIKKKRSVLTFQQVQTLMQAYYNNCYLDLFTKENLARTTGLAVKRVCFLLKC